jgi:hypothetical protein
MPFQSKAQMRYMYAKHPKIAKKWTKEMDAKADSPWTKMLPEKKEK